MSVQVENLEKNMAKLTIEVPAEELEKALEKAYQKQKKNISVPGFRKGKVPRAMVEKMYGPAVFYEDAVNSLVPEEYSKAAEESKLDIVSRPEINVEQIEKGKAFIFTATVAVKPEVTLGAYEGVEVPKTEINVTDEEVEAELKKEQEKNARTINVEDRPAADGDTVTLDFEGSVDGVPFDGGAGKDYPLTLGSHSFIPGFEEQLVGAALEEEKEKAFAIGAKEAEVSDRELANQKERYQEMLSEQKLFRKHNKKKLEAKKQLADLLPEKPECIQEKYWNEKIYGKTGKYFIYLDGNKVNIPDEKAAELEEYLGNMRKYREKKKELMERQKDGQ